MVALFRLSVNELKRQFKRLGLKVDVEEVKASQLVIKSEDGKVYEMEAPEAVILVKLPAGVYMVQAVGSIEVREERGGGEGAGFSEEDVRLVTEQAGVSLEEARKALEEAGGDIAAAILLLQERKR